MSAADEGRTATGFAVDFLIIGAQKAGTSWLHAKLREQPGLWLPVDKDFEYFSYPGATPPEAYRTRFAGAPDGARIGDACASYFWTSGRSSGNPGFARDLPADIDGALGPDARYIVLLRDPVERSISAYLHHIAFGSLEAGVPLLNAPQALGLVDISRYGAHLEAWLEVVGRQRLRVLPTPEETDAPELVRRACEFLGGPAEPSPVDDAPVFPGLRRRRDNDGIWVEVGQPGVLRPVGSEREIDGRSWTRLVDAETIEALRDLLAPDTARLAALLDGDEPVFAAWPTWPSAG